MHESCTHMLPFILYHGQIGQLTNRMGSLLARSKPSQDALALHCLHGHLLVAIHEEATGGLTLINDAATLLGLLLSYLKFPVNS